MRTSLVLVAVLGTLVGHTSADEPAGPRQWILVTTPALRAAAEPLVERRRGQGWSVAEVAPSATAGSAADPAALRLRIDEARAAFEGTSVVLLLGGYEADAIPPFPGEHGRMAGQPTDHPYGAPDEKEAVTVAVGRLPARTLDEARAMVAKTLALEDRLPETGTNRVHLMIGDPGAKTKLEERFARAIVRNTAETRLEAIHPMWRPVCIADTPDNRFSHVGESFDQTARSLLYRGHLLAGYAGHSGAAGLWSPAREAFNVPREVFEQLDQGEAPGVFVSCGCWGCQIDGADGPGYVLAAIRNPRGPAAGIGAFGESYAAFGQFALDGVVGLLGSDELPRTLGAYWLAAQHGLVNGRMSSIQFWLYDQADGSGGNVPLDRQRLEHAEMWTLLGDPALRLPFVRPTLAVAVEGEGKPGGKLDVTVEVPEGIDLGDGEVRVWIEPRHLRAADVAPSRKAGHEPGMLAWDSAAIEGGRARVSLTLPDVPIEFELVARAWAGTGKAAAHGVSVVPPAAMAEEQKRE